MKKAPSTVNLCSQLYVSDVTESFRNIPVMRLAACIAASVM